MAGSVGAGATSTGLQFGSRAGRYTLIATVLGSAMAAIDSTVVSIALPRIGRQFHASLAGLQWVVTAYLLVLAGLLLLAGALGDRFGRRRIFLLGAVWFATASCLCGIAPNAGVLIAARALQGVGGALLTPGSLAILEASFDKKDRARAIGAWSGLGGVAFAAGPLLGGWLIQASSWRLIFYLNIPLAVAVVVLTLRFVPESCDETAPRSVDVLGAAAITLGLVGLSYGLIEAPAEGWGSAGVVTALAAGVAMIAAFVRREQRSDGPLIPLDIFSSRQFSGTNAVTFVVYGALGGSLFLVPIELQQVSRYSPLEAGVSLLPMTLLMLLFSSRSGALAQWIGPRLQMSVGPVLVGVGMALLARIGAGGSYPAEVLPGVLVLGSGLAVTVAPLTATALSSAPTEHAGVASAVNNDVARGASLIAVSVLPAAAGIVGSSYLHPARFTQGFRLAMFEAGGAAVLGGLLAFATIRNPRGESVPTSDSLAAPDPQSPR